MLHPIILAGGSGTRLWPMSRDQFPKPFLRINSDNSMIQETILRLDEINRKDPIIVCNEEHRFLVLDHLEQISRAPSKIILEPQGRNTAPALTLAAIDAFKQDEDSILLSLHADHIIEDLSKFHEDLMVGLELAKSGGVVTFGVKPSEPNTAYGYIQTNSKIRSEYYPIKSFVEKPDIDTAVAMVKSGNYLWNTGMFMMKSSVWLDQINLYSPQIFSTCQRATRKGSLDDLFFRPDDREFKSCPSEAIDYAVMEKMTVDINNKVPCWVVPINTSWSDLGTWSSIWLNKKSDGLGNVTEGDVVLKSVSNSLVIGNGRTIVAAGISDMVVIDTQDVVLITKKNDNDLIREITKEIRINRNDLLRAHKTVSRPWGYYQIIYTGENFQIKSLNIKTGAAISLQKHQHRAEHWVVVHGQASVTKNDETFILKENESTFVPIGSTHRIENKSDQLLEIIEIQCGSYLGEDDIIRLNDNYNRTD